MRMLMQINTFKRSTLVLFLILLISLVFLKVFRWDGYEGSNKYDVIGSDGKGYYAYLPAIFLHHHLDSLPDDQAYTNPISGRNVIKYTAGTALLQLPFFSMAVVVAKILQFEVDGYSAPFQLMVAISAIFYMFLGMVFLRQLLRSQHFRESTIALVLILVFFGTNLLYYSIMAGRMSHVYSFALITLFSLLTHRFFLKPTVSRLFFISFILAMIVLIRPANVLVVFLIPFFAGSWQRIHDVIRWCIAKWPFAFLALLILLSLISLQFILWYVQSGKFMIWSYADEGFYLLSPQISNVLFSFSEGLFIYTPIIFISLFGLVSLYRQNRFKFYSLLAFLVLITWMIASWWNWYYGDGFGQRAFIDFYVVFAMLLAFAIDFLKSRLFRQIYIGIALMLGIFCLFQTWQFYMGIIHAFSMNAEKYRYVCLKTSSDFRFVLGGNDDIAPFSKKQKVLILETFNDFEGQQPGWNNGKVLLFPSQENEQNPCSSFTENEFGSGFSVSGDHMSVQYRKLFVEISLSRIESELHSSSKALFVAEIRDAEGKNTHYHAFRLNDTPDTSPGTWRSFHYSLVLPGFTSTNDTLRMYVWNKERQHFLIDDFEIRIFGVY